MTIPRIVSAIVVAGLALAAALGTANFIRAAGVTAQGGVPVRPSATAAVGPTTAGPVPAVGRNFDWVYHASGPFIFADHALVCALDPILDLPRRALPEARAVPSRGSRTISTDAEAASEAARNEADLDALFAVAVRVKPARIEAAKDAQGERGKRVYLDLCYACHQPDGQGLPGTFPMLANSDFMAADRTRAIRIVLEGLAGPVTVNGETINSVMPAQKTVLTDQQIADVLTYVFNAWENPGGAFSRAQVEVIRKGEGR